MSGSEDDRKSLIRGVMVIPTGSMEEVVNGVQKWRSRMRTLTYWGLGLPDLSEMNGVLRDATNPYLQHIDEDCRHELGELRRSTKIARATGPVMMLKDDGTMDLHEGLEQYSHMIEGALRVVVNRKFKERKKTVPKGYAGTEVQPPLDVPEPPPAGATVSGPDAAKKAQEGKGKGKGNERPSNIPDPIMWKGISFKPRVKMEVRMWNPRGFGQLALKDPSRVEEKYRKEAFVHKSMIVDGSALKVGTDVEAFLTVDAASAKVYAGRVTGGVGPLHEGYKEAICPYCKSKGHPGKKVSGAREMQSVPQDGPHGE